MSVPLLVTLFLLLIATSLANCSRDISPFNNLNESSCTQNMSSLNTFVYPSSLQLPEMTSTKDFHGTQVVDKFAWLEDPHSPDVKAWVDAQNEVTEGYLKKLDFKAKMTARCAL